MTTVYDGEIHILPYRPKICRTKVSKFQLGVENFVRRNILSNISIQKSGKNRTKVSKFRLGVENFVRRKFCPTNFCPIRYSCQGSCHVRMRSKGVLVMSIYFSDEWQ